MAPKQTAKPVFKTGTPFTETTWSAHAPLLALYVPADNWTAGRPQMSQCDQDIVLDLVCK